MKITDKILIIDDEPDIRELIMLTLKRMDIAADAVGTVADGKNLIKKNSYFLILTDMKLTDGSGLELVQYVEQHKPYTPIAVITAFGSIENAVQVLKAGAFDYVSKPINLSILKSLVNTALTIFQRLPESIDDILIGDSLAMQNLKANIKKLALNQAPVFIYGESGVGKELVARMIHEYGPRSGKPFIAVNCGAIPNELMESEFFGHRKGSFTGAHTDTIGLFEAANGGTLFLDEIAELPLLMQVKLLRAIQEKAIKPIGGLQEIPVDVRILSASNKDLLTQIDNGNFRQELYYRINVIELTVPPLRDRLDDIPLLATHILNKLALEHNKPTPKFSDSFINTLKSYDFIGNVRELENILERTIVLANSDIITDKDLDFASSDRRKIKINNFAKPEQDNIVQDEMIESKIATLEEQMLEHERCVILEALEANKWNKTTTAKALGISFRTLRYRLQKLNL